MHELKCLWPGLENITHIQRITEQEGDINASHAFAYFLTRTPLWPQDHPVMHVGPAPAPASHHTPSKVSLIYENNLKKNFQFTFNIPAIICLYVVLLDF